MRESVRDAVTLIEPSALFDEAWYAARCGRTFPDRRTAITDYVRTHGRDGTPHPLFADRWLYPHRRWVARSPDPLSDYLSAPERRPRSPHPLLDVATILAAEPRAGDAALGPVDAWLRRATPESPLPLRHGRLTLGEAIAAIAEGRLPLSPADRSRTSTTVLVLPPDRPDAAVVTVAWMWWLHRTGLRTAVVARDREVASIAAGIAASLSDTSVGDLTATLAAAEVVVLLRPTRRPTAWTDLRTLATTLDDPAVAVAHAVLVDDDRTVAAAGATWLDGGPRPFLAGHPVADARRVASTPLAGAWPGAVAVRADLLDPARLERLDRRYELGLAGPIRLVPPALVPAVALPADDPDDVRDRHRPDPETDQAAWRAAGFAGPDRPLRITESPPRLRWAIDTAGPFRDGAWGDLHFAEALGGALADLGQDVAVDHPESRGRASRELDDVVLVIRGLDRVVADPTARARQVRLLWVISHPDAVDADEVAAHDATWAAGPVWAERRSRDWGLPIGTLLQATDPARFHPGLAEPDSGPQLLFVGNRRGGDRPAVLHSVAASLRPSVYGMGWAGIVDTVADHVDNRDLGALYASAGIVLNDHWPDMAAEGFVSNRVFDVLATGARLLTDHVTGIESLLPEVSVFTGPDDLAAAVGDREHAFPDRSARLALAARVADEHSFAARAGVLLDAAVAHHRTRSFPEGRPGGS